VKVVVAHNRYRSNVPSGENVVVDAEIAALTASGVEVVPFLRSSDEIEHFGVGDKVRTAVGPLISPAPQRELDRIITAERPDVLHVHNVYPLLGPSIIRTAHDRGLAIVHTVHNFRLDCVAGTYLRDGAICTDCSGHAIATPALQHGCYRGSRAQTVPMVASRTTHRRTWELVDRFVVLTSFHARFLQSLGVPDDRITIRANSVADPGAPTAPGRDVLFVGRLGHEKGVDVLLKAWASSTASTNGRRLRLVGDGDLREVATRAAASDPSIDVLGSLASDHVAAEMRAAGLIVIPSTCYEGFPVVLAEAASHGRGVMVSDHGGLGAIVEESFGIRVAPGLVTEWTAALDALDDGAVRQLGDGARAFYERALTPGAAISSLTAAYDAAITTRRASDA
jgi:glycosyltransferase involved in cell wall biosynthesis